jgi:hypothetical protein
MAVKPTSVTQWLCYPILHVQVSLLASGRLLYHGLCDEMVPWFESVGYTYTPGEVAAGQDSRG